MRLFSVILQINIISRKLFIRYSSLMKNNKINFKAFSDLPEEVRGEIVSATMKLLFDGSQV